MVLRIVKYTYDVKNILVMFCDLTMPILEQFAGLKVSTKIYLLY